MKLCLNMKDGSEIYITNAEEFVGGFAYFYIRLDGDAPCYANEHVCAATTLSYPRSSILNIMRIYPDGTQKKVHLKSVPAVKEKQHDYSSRSSGGI